MLFLALSLMFSSCDMSKEIVYFQDIHEYRAADGSEGQTTPEIRLRPEDKISIIVNSKVPELTALFNLPYTARTLGSTSESVSNTSQGTSGYTIKADGTIDFPVLGAVQAAGKTRDELSAHIKAELINRTKANGGRVFAVGTTCTRTLESVATYKGGFVADEGWTSIFIYPGYRFKTVDGLITNFHLPESTLVMLVSALAGRENVLNAYKEAVNERYRFFSFGDAMFIH